ncbi:MAG: hypothetical protein GY809_29760, partial [Planctomycetes bacterium]|nr:hypothetical protein [Planctomycetota bacterium]
MLTIVDEYTRECLAIDVARRLRANDVLDRLAELFDEDGDSKTRARLKYDYRLTLSGLHFEAMQLWVDWTREH